MRPDATEGDPVKLTYADIALIRAAASLAEHAPQKMRAAHLAPRLENLARRVAAGISPASPAADASVRPEPELRRAA